MPDAPDHLGYERSMRLAMHARSVVLFDATMSLDLCLETRFSDGELHDPSP